MGGAKCGRRNHSIRLFVLPIRNFRTVIVRVALMSGIEQLNNRNLTSRKTYDQGKDSQWTSARLGRSLWAAYRTVLGARPFWCAVRLWPNLVLGLGHYQVVFGAYCVIQRLSGFLRALAT